MRHRPGRRLPAAAVTMALLATLAGCGTRTGADASNTPALAGPTTSPGVQYVEGAEVTDAPSAPAVVAKLGTGKLLDAVERSMRTQRSVHEILEVRGPKLTVTGEGDVRYAPVPALQMELASSTASSAYGFATWVDDTYYFSFPALMGRGKYVSLSLSSTNNPLGADFAKFSAQVDTLGALAVMRPAVTGARYVGPDEQYGEPVAHYRLRIDTRRGFARQGVDAAQVGRVPDELVYDLWMDAKKLPVKIRTRVAGYRITTELSDWGKAVRIRVPKPGDVVRLPGS